MKKYLIILFTLSIICIETSQAQLRVYPTRVVLDSKHRSAKLSLKNMTNKAIRYKINTILMKMTPQGNLEFAKEGEVISTSAIEMFRYSPRRVSLDPKKEQIVRVLLKAQSDIADGDYIAHMQFEEIIDEAELKRMAEANKPKGNQGIAAVLRPLIAIAIPVVVRLGKPSAKVEISNLKPLQEKDTYVSFDLLKEGNAITWGDLKISHQKSGEKPKVIGNFQGIASYIPKRLVKYKLNDFHPNQGDKLVVEFLRPEEEGGELIARSETQIP